MSTEYATDLANNRINLNYRNTSTDTLKLVVRRMPLNKLVNDNDSPEYRDHYHEFMLNGILWQMYSKQDAETIDVAKADSYYAMYMKDVDEVKQQEVILDSRLRPNYSLDGFR